MSSPTERPRGAPDEQHEAPLALVMAKTASSSDGVEGNRTRVQGIGVSSATGRGAVSVIGDFTSPASSR
jgi:hypothetical protein